MMDEQSYEIGRNKAYITVMIDCTRALGFDGIDALDTARVRWIAERQAVVDALRDLCETFGDNDWPDELHLGDAIEKHLARPLHATRNLMIERGLIGESKIMATHREPMMTWAEHRADKAQFMEHVVTSVVRGVMHNLYINDSKRIHDEVEIWLDYWRDCMGPPEEKSRQSERA